MKHVERARESNVVVSVLTQHVIYSLPNVYNRLEKKEMTEF